MLKHKYNEWTPFYNVYYLKSVFTRLALLSLSFFLVLKRLLVELKVLIISIPNMNNVDIWLLCKQSQQDGKFLQLVSFCSSYT